MKFCHKVYSIEWLCSSVRTARGWVHQLMMIALRDALAGLYQAECNTDPVIMKT